MHSNAPSENPSDINHGQLFSASQIRAAIHEWIDKYNSNPDEFETEEYDADSQADYLIGLMTAQK
ncbi:hypothetical protein [Hafnia alvei]|uniref:hypothetical protein n=1 Tax=Hafnia alvei TaxID=569 RepID=UPI000DFE5DCF|nr:hypothetical protein [Hafnia alvei]STQ67929.1 Uncharacterised protein [Hafnia alvei]